MVLKNISEHSRFQDATQIKVLIKRKFLLSNVAIKSEVKPLSKEWPG